MKLRGWQKICAFTYVQSMKSKAMKITFAILCAIVMVSMPVSSLLAGAGKDEEESSTAIETVYVYDNTGIIASQLVEGKITNELYGNISYIVREDKENIEELINREDNRNDIFLLVEFSSDETGLSYGTGICAYYKEDSLVSADDAEAYALFVEDNLERAILSYAGASEDDIEKIVKAAEYEVICLDKSGNIIENDEGISQFQYNFSLVVICLLIFMISFMGSKVSELIVTEKATRVIEYIMTSVKPMAVLVGKVIGASLMMLTIFLGLMISMVISIFVNNALFPSETGGIVLPSALEAMVTGGGISGITPVNIVLIIVLILFGCVFYGLVAGIAGATVSKIEEMAEGMKIFTFAMLIGAYLPLFLSVTNEVGEGWGAMSYVVYLLPLSSVFILPQYLIMGKVSALLVLLAVVISAAGILLVLFLVNKVYEHMLYSNGTALKLKDIIAMAKAGKEGHYGKE